MSATGEQQRVDPTARDLDLFESLVDSRVMSTEQIAALHFGGAIDYTYKRLRKLSSAGLIATRPRATAAKPNVFYLTKPGFDCLLAVRRAVPLINWPEMDRRLRNLGDQFLAHELSVNDALIALRNTIASSDRYRVARCSTWPRRHGFDAPDENGVLRPMRPDGFLSVTWIDDEGQATRDYFLELDRSEEVLAELVDKAMRYRWYSNSGCYARDFCAVEADRLSDIDPRDFHFTVLYIVPSEARRNNIAEKLLNAIPPIKQLVWLTTLDELLSQPLGPIWVRPKDVLIANRGTPFDAHVGDRPGSAARDRHLANTLPKWALLDEPN